MGYYDFPHTRNYDTDLGYLIKQYLNLREEVNNLIASQTIVYADPLQWSIDKQYRVNTIVINGYNAYLSKQPVPLGIEITNTDYWLVVGDFIKEFDDIRENIANANEHTSTTATAARLKDSLVWLNDELYIVLRDIQIGDRYVVDENVKTITIEEYISNRIANLKYYVDNNYSKIKTYNVLDYNVKNDGVTDNYNALLSLMATISNNGGIIYFPDGVYLTSNTIPIPSNTMFIGESHNAIIYFDGSHPEYGTTLCPAGSNIIIKNISVNYYEPDKTTFVTGSQLGSIGISTKAFKPNTNASDLPDGNVEHIIIDNVFSDNTAPLQTEPGPAPYYVKDIHYQNCYLPNGQARISPTANCLLYGCYIENTNAKGIGIGYNENTSKGIIINNCITNLLNIVDSNVTINNTFVYGTGVKIDNNLKEYSCRLLGNHITLNNVTIINQNPSVTIGINLTDEVTTTDYKFNNVVVLGFSRAWRSSAGNKTCKFSNCYLEASDTITGNALYGQVINSYVERFNTLTGCKNYDKGSTYTITPKPDVSLTASLPDSAILIGDTVHLKFSINISTLSLATDTEYLTLPPSLWPSSIKYISALVYNLSTLKLTPITLKINTNGVISAGGFYTDISSDSNNRIIVDSSYLLD